MAIKRKLDFDVLSDCSQPQAPKLIKLVPFPGYEPDIDVTMSDSSDSENFHSRLDSTVSTASDCSSLCEDLDLNSPLYPRLLTSQPLLDPSPDSPKVIGLLQPVSSFSHHGSSCSQIPKLRVASSARPDGSRTMWSFCADCGAISMVNTD